MRVKEESEKPGLKLNIQKTKITASDPITSWQTEGENVEAVTYFLFLSSKITADGDMTAAMTLRKTLAPQKESYDTLGQHFEKQTHQFTNKRPYSQSYDFSSSHAQM